MLLNGTLYQHLAEAERICSDRIERIITQMAKREGVTEALKASVQLEWAGRMNNIRNRAEEIVLAEVVYKWEGMMLSVSCIRATFVRATVVSVATPILQSRWMPLPCY